MPFLAEGEGFDMTDITITINDAQGTAQLQGLLSKTQSHVGKALKLDLADVRKPSTLLMQLLLVTQAEWERHSAPFSLSGVSENVRNAFNSAGADKLVTCIMER